MYVSCSIVQSPSSFSEYETAPAVPLPGAAHRGRRRDRGKVGVDLDVGQVVPEPPDARPRDELAVVELDPLQVVAGHQVVEGLRCYSVML